MGASAGAGDGEWVPVKDAAERLGLTVDQARRRLRSGQLQGRQVPVAQGHVWEVWLSDDTPAASGAGGPDPDPNAEDQAVPYEPAGNGSLTDAVHQTPDVVRAAPDARRAASDGMHTASDARRQTPDAAPEGLGTELVSSQRAREMAEYSAALLEPWRRRVEELSRENGRLEERAEHLEEQGAHLQAELERRDTELEQARAQLAETPALKEPPEPQNGAAPHDEERRRWWQRLLTWATAEGRA